MIRTKFCKWCGKSKCRCAKPKRSGLPYRWAEATTEQLILVALVVILNQEIATGRLSSEAGDVRALLAEMQRRAGAAVEAIEPAV